MFAFKDLLLDRPSNYNLSEIALKSGFKFRDIENRRLDWKTLGCIDVNKVIENQDFQFLEKITPKIIEAPMQSILGTAALDPAVSSLFRLAQLSLQYLSFCQQFMSHTLFDLRTAFNHLQKKYSSLKQNYKCLEEEHYKAQERIQLLLNENKGELNRTSNQISKPSSLFPCDQCTKNFLTFDSLKSHQQRKHSIIEEKHELSDDNEKDNEKEKDDGLIEQNEINAKELSTVQEESSISKSEVTQLDNNNDETESNANCVACSQKAKANSSSIAIQCEVANIGAQEMPSRHEELKTRANVDNDENPEQNNTEEIPKHDNKLDNELVQCAYQTINELKQEIVDLKNSLEAKTRTETTSEQSATTKEANLVETNDKIDVIEQKFNAFEGMFMESQNQFIETFRNLDQRQKVYMDNIQETIKEIVEKSLGQHTIDKVSAIDSKLENFDNLGNCPSEAENKDSMESKKNEDIRNNENNCKSEPHPQVKPRKLNHNAPIDSSSQTEDEEIKIVCQADVHAESQSELNGHDQDNKVAKKKTKVLNNKFSKDVALNEFEQRLRQFGVDVDSTGLPTPRSCEVNQDLAEEREEMKRAHKSFAVTRKKLRYEVDRIAKDKLTSASSVTSQSSTPYQSDDQMIDENDSQKCKPVKLRPKSASVQKMRSRNAKKLMQKLVENDIDENDIQDKMQKAQKAINAHRECIQELLQTTAHSPSSLTKIKYPTSGATNGEESKAKNNGENTEITSNQYNKMPNVTTRRVVFVNLDEDS